MQSMSKQNYKGDNKVNALISVEKAAELLGISQWTVRAYIRDKKLTPVHIGRRVLIEPNEIQRFVAAAKKADESVQK